MKDDKKKLLVVGLLFVVILAVGAFQFMGSSTPAPKPEAKKTEGAAEAAEEGAEANVEKDQESDPVRQLYAMGLPARDPFAEENLPDMPGQTPAKPAEQTQPSKPVASNSGSRRGFTPPLPPINPMPGGFNIQPSPGMNGSLPAVGGGAPTDGPNYSVSGVIQGEKNAAVISDGQGNQRLIHEGQQLDGDSRVVSIRGDKVVIKRKNKTVTLTVGGNP
jgi:hypothetical protein